MDIESYLKEKKQAVDDHLSRFLPKDDSLLSQAMRYSALACGKRLRPILAISAAHSVGGREESIMPAACAIELIHTFSLIHDDLPAMDNDDMRRGIAASHKKFGEAMAILAADALFALAFRIISEKQNRRGIPDEALLDVIHEIGMAVGHEGMCSGQSIDLLSEGQNISFDKLKEIHRKKTGNLVVASVCAGAKLSKAGEVQLNCLKKYADHLGLAFQIKDDILDVKGFLKELGKNPGADVKKKKATYPSILGMEKSEKLLSEEKEAALDSISGFDKNADPLRELAKFVVKRNI